MNRSIKQHLFRTFAVALFSLMFSSQTFATTVELHFMHGFGHWAPEGQQRIVDAFNAAHPNIRVTLEVVPNGQAGELLAVRTAAGVGPDIVTVHPRDFFAAASEGLLMDLTTLVETQLDHLSDFPRPALETGMINGRIFALPQRLSTYVLYYNKDAFAAAGLPNLPTDWNDASWNWDALAQYVERLSIDRSGDGNIDRFGINTDRNPGLKFMSFILQSGVHLYDEEYREFTFGRPEGHTAVDYMLEMVQRNRVGGNFANGTTAMQIDIPPYLSTLINTQPAFEWDVAPLAQGPAGPATTLQPIPIGLNSGTAHPAEAWQFLQYYMSATVGVQESLDGIIVQPRVSVAADPASYPDVPVTDFGVFTQALAVGQPLRDKHPQAAEMLRTINTALGSVWTGEVAARVALEEIRPTIESMLAGR